MILIEDVMPQSVDSTSAFVAQLSSLIDGVTHNVEQLVLRFYVDHRDCSLCLAEAGVMCRTVGGQNLRRTHLCRLQGSDLERVAVVHWAILQDQHRDRVSW